MSTNSSNCYVTFVTAQKVKNPILQADCICHLEVIMTSLISRCVVKRFVSCRILLKVYDSDIFNFGNVKLELVKDSFSNKQTYCTSAQILNLDKAAGQLRRKETPKSKVIKSVQNAFSCTYEEAHTLVNDNNHLLYTVGEVSLSKLEALQDAGISLQTIKQNIWLLSFDLGEFYRYLHYIKKWEFKDINDAVSMFKLPFKKLERYTLKMCKDSHELSGYGNRIKYFVHHIQCSEKEACEKFVKYQFMFRIDVNWVKENMKILLNVGCEPSWIFRDVQDFRYSPQFLKERAKKISELTDEVILDPVKPWMLRCKSDILERTCNIREEKHAVLSPHTSVMDFLCDQLQLSPERLELMLARHPAVRAVQVSKLKEIIDFLYLEGFSSEQIYNSPRVLCHSLVTLKERLKLLQDHGYNIKSLLTLCKNSKDFKELLQKLKEREKYKLGT